MSLRFFQYLHLVLLCSLYSICSYSNEPQSENINISKLYADSLYSSGSYEQAIDVYHKIIKEKGFSPELYYNLGNSYYKMNDMAHAILNYERGLKLDPSDSDIRYNLSIARSKIQDKNSAPSEFFIVAWWKSFSNLFSLNQLKTLGLVCFVIFLCSIIYITLKKKEIKSYLKYVSAFFFVLFLICNLSAYQQYRNIVSTKCGIVTAESVNVKSSPSKNSMDLFEIHSGTRLTILDNSMKEWIEVRYEDEKEGWIERETIELI